MSLLHETWSELVLLDHIYRQVWFSNQENILLVSGESVSSKFLPFHLTTNPVPMTQKLILFQVSSVINGGICQGDIGATKLIEKVMEMTNRFRQLQIDRTELVCLKFLILFEVKEKVLASFNLENPVIIRHEPSKTFKGHETSQFSIYESCLWTNPTGFKWIYDQKLSRPRRTIFTSHYEVTRPKSSQVRNFSYNLIWYKISCI